MVRACDAKRGALRGKEGDGNESTRKRGRPKRRWLARVSSECKYNGCVDESAW